MRQLPEFNWYTITAVGLAIVGLTLSVYGTLVSNPYLGILGISVVCSGGIAALLGLQDSV